MVLKMVHSGGRGSRTARGVDNHFSIGMSAGLTAGSMRSIANSHSSDLRESAEGSPVFQPMPGRKPGKIGGAKAPAAKTGLRMGAKPIPDFPQKGSGQRLKIRQLRGAHFLHPAPDGVKSSGGSGGER